MPDEAQTLIGQARAGSLRARQQLVLRQHAALMGLIRSDLGARTRAFVDPEDVLQEVYVGLIRSFDTFSGDDADTFRRWALAVARNKVREIGRRYLNTGGRGGQARHAHVTGRFSCVSASLAAAVEARLTTVAGRVVRIEALDSLAAALAVLPEHYRQVLEMQYLLGLPVDEVARKMKRSKGSVLMLSHRARHQMASLLRQFPLLTES